MLRLCSLGSCEGSGSWGQHSCGDEARSSIFKSSGTLRMRENTSGWRSVANCECFSSLHLVFKKKSFIYLYIYLFVCVRARVHALARAISARIWCVCVYAYLLVCALSSCRRLQRPEEGGRSPRTGVTGGCKSLGVGAENSIVPCQSNVLLITEPPL